MTFVESAGYEVLTTREPGGTPLAEDIRHLLMHRGDEDIPEIAELLLMFAARSLNVNNNIRPALNAGKWVICDRFTDSSRAYQGAGRGLPLETVDQLAEWVHGDLWPDLTILLDAPVEVGMARAGNRSKPDRIEQAAAIAAAFPEVTHNYERDGIYNLWFTIIAETAARMQAIVQAVLDGDGVDAVHMLPALETFKINVRFNLEEHSDAV